MKEFQEKISIWSFWLVISISIVALAGWIGNALSFAGMGENYIPMAPLTIICFLLSSSAALYLLNNRINIIPVRIILTTVIISCLIVLADTLTGYSIGFERIFGNSPESLNNLPIGRMSPITSVLFLVSAISLLFISAKNKWPKIAAILLTAALLVVFTFDLGYLYGTPLLYKQSIIPPAWNTSLAFTLLFVGLLSGFCMNEEPLKLFVGESLRARLMRVFLPLPLLIIILAGWIDAIVIKIFNDQVLISSLVTIFSLLLLSFIILKLAKKIGNDVDNIFASRKETEEKLCESELHFRTLADSGQALIWTSGTDKKCDYFNQPWLDFTGRSIEQELGDGWAEGVHPDDLDRCFRIYSDAFDRQERFSMDYRLRYRDGSYHWIQDNGTPRFNTSGKFIGYIGHCLDIAERKSAEVALTESEERYRLISSVATDYTFSTKVLPDGSLDLNWVAGAFESISGYSVEEFKVRGAWRATIHPEDLHIDDNDIACLRSNRDTKSEIRTFNRNGEIVWVQVFAHPIWDDKKNCLSGIYGAVKNITDQKNAEEKLIKSELRFRELLEKVSLISVILDTEGKVTFCNDYLLELTGFKSEELIGQNWFDRMIPERISEVKKVFMDGLKNGNVASRFENPILTKSGKSLDIVWSNVVQRNHEGLIMGIASIGEDITEQKLAQDKILKLSKGIEQSPVSIEITDTNGIIEYVNPIFCETTGFTAEEIIGKHARVLRSDQMPPETYDDLWVTIKSGGIWRKELLNKKKDGSLFWESVTLTSIKNDKGLITNFIAIKENISERKKMEAELIKAKEKAEESDHLKSAFLANMSHEIRTPLNSIIGFSELLGDPEFDQEQKDEFRQTIVDNGNNLLVIISDIMDFSMLEAHQIKIRREVFSTRKLLTDLQNDFSKKANQKGIEFRIIQPSEKPDILIESDLYRIKQIFNNLIGNALKFTKKGFVEIGYQLKDEVVTFHIKDTGIGIDPAYHQSIFERFRQVDLAKTRKYGGNGLGLAISKNLAELLGGTIWVESEPDKFSNFFFTIPIK